MNEDRYLEHELHRVSEEGKIVPYFKNKDKCSTCFSEWFKVKEKSKIKSYGKITGREHINIIGDLDFAR